MFTEFVRTTDTCDWPRCTPRHAWGREGSVGKSAHRRRSRRGDAVKWRRDSRPRLEDTAERLTVRGIFRVDRDSAPLGDRATVQGWLRELHRGRNQQVFVHRRWGTIVAVADGRHPVTVILHDGEKSWLAAAPGAADDQELTPDQVEHVLLDALAAESRPQWPDWRYLV